MTRGKYRYVKQPPKKVRPRWVSFVSYSAIVLGSFFLFWAFYPIISFEIYSRVFLTNKIFTPLAKEKAESVKQANEILGSQDIYSTNLVDYTQAGIWFPSVSKDKVAPSNFSNYSLSIPKLGIEEANVIVGGEDLKKGLVHYLPKTMPGEKGNLTVFGHSTLAQLYNVHDYKTIFTYLPTMEKGDVIFLETTEGRYKYEVFDKFVVTPEEIEVLDQQYDDSYLTLVTCVPPGTYWKRAVVKAKLVKT